MTGKLACLKHSPGSLIHLCETLGRYAIDQVHVAVVVAGVYVEIEVFLRQHVDVLVRALLGEPDHAAANFKVAIGSVRIAHR
jgi:hypothetical protein